MTDSRRAASDTPVDVIQTGHFQGYLAPLVHKRVCSMLSQSKPARFVIIFFSKVGNTLFFALPTYSGSIRIPK
jgi:hypothetical protein